MIGAVIAPGPRTWLRGPTRAEEASAAEGGPRAGLMIPCYIDMFYPAAGVAALELPEKLGVEVGYRFDQSCCGQPMANAAPTRRPRPPRSCSSAISPATIPSSPRRGSRVHYLRNKFTTADDTPERRHVPAHMHDLPELLCDVLKVRAAVRRAWVRSFPDRPVPADPPEPGSCANRSVGSFLNIMPNDDVFPCHVLTQHEFRCGNLREGLPPPNWADCWSGAASWTTLNRSCATGPTPTCLPLSSWPGCWPSAATSTGGTPGPPPATRLRPSGWLSC